MGALAISFAVGACGGGDDNASPSASSKPTTAVTGRTATTKALAASGPVPTAATCPTSAELAAIFKVPPSPSQQQPRPSSSGVSCDYRWDPDPISTVSVSLYRYPARDVIESMYARTLKQSEDVAAGRNKSGEPGTITQISGVGDAAYVQMEQPSKGENRPPDYYFNARAGTLLLRLHVVDYSGTRFGPNTGNPDQLVALGKLLITKAG
jgi:hypothetical protein